MNSIPSEKINVIVCVPYVRTFIVRVRVNQKIETIKRAFPNLNNQNDLIYWLDGAQIVPNLTFKEVGIHDNSAIVVTVQTYEITFNKFFISMSKYINEKTYIDRIIKKIYNKNDEKCITGRIISRRFNYEQEEKKYFFVQKLKQLLHQFNFSKTESKPMIDENHVTSYDPSPMPILY